MRTRTTDIELAEVLARNSSLKLASQPPRIESGSVRAQTEDQKPAIGGNARKARRNYKSELVEILRFRGIEVESEFKVFEDRKFRADWRVVGTKVLIEFEGGLFHAGKQGHSSVSGILRDVEKYNLCAIAGWIVIRVSPKHIESGQAMIWIENAIEFSGAF